MTDASPRFTETFCSQCGRAFGPGDHGYSHCENHRTRTIVDPIEVIYSAFDKQTYDENVRRNWDLPDDYEHSISLSAKQIREFNKAYETYENDVKSFFTGTLITALQDIVGAHLGDCPASMDEADFARAHNHRVRRIARDALVKVGLAS